MRILMTGATGFIGRRLVPHLQFQHELVVLSRNPTRAYQRLGHNIQAINSLDRLSSLDSFDAVINLAGEPIADRRWSKKQKRRICLSRWQITQQLADLLKAGERPPEVVISGSAIGYYAKQEEHPIDESCQVPESTSAFTHQVCQQWEKIAHSMQNPQTRVCIIRTGVVLGHEGGALAKMLPSFKLGVGGPLGSGQQYMSWIHIHDAVNAIIFLLLHKECQGIYNLTAPNPVRNHQFSQCLAHNLHRPNLFRMPAAILSMLFGEMSQLLLEGQNIIPTRLQQAGYDFKFPQIEPALRELLHPGNGHK